LGGTRWDKGLDILLDALADIKVPFHLLIAGKAQFFTREEIEKRVAPYAENVTMLLEFLSDEKFSLCLSAADIVVLPYRKQFDGASGPLGEGVWRNKMIVGANHGSLGQIISDNHLGMVFESENVQSLSSVLNKALTVEFCRDEVYVRYRGRMNPERFQKEYGQLYAEVIEK
ncbi:MAG: glycosyltransferase, partial [Clostridiales bacterium]|nr:glycosyltransferase [Clostridiales bacterium]